MLKIGPKACTHSPAQPCVRLPGGRHTSCGRTRCVCCAAPAFKQKGSGGSLDTRPHLHTHTHTCVDIAPAQTCIVVSLEQKRYKQTCSSGGGSRGLGGMLYMSTSGTAPSELPQQLLLWLQLQRSKTKDPASDVYILTCGADPTRAGQLMSSVTWRMAWNTPMPLIS